MTHQYNGTAVSIFGKTVTPGSTTPTAGSDGKTLALNTGDSAVTIGQGTYDLGAFTGQFAEVLIYNQVLSAGDRQAVEDYLYTKYTTPVPEPASAALLVVSGIALAARRARRASPTVAR